MEMLVFDIAGAEYAVDLRDIDEVLNMPALRQEPSAPSFLAGIFNLRGVLVPVVDILERLGKFRPPPPPPPMTASEDAQSAYPIGTRVLIASHAAEPGQPITRFGVIMDHWVDFRQFEDDSYCHSVLQDSATAPFINGANVGENGLIQHILVRHLLHDEERQILAQLDL